MFWLIHLIIKWAVVSGVFIGLGFALPGFQIGARSARKAAPRPSSLTAGRPALARALGSEEAPPPARGDGTWAGFLLAAVAFGGANVLLGWLLGFVLKFLIFLPNLLTFGLLGLLVPVAVNAFLLKVVDTRFGRAVEIETFKALLVAAAIISFAGALVDKAI